MGNSRFNYEIDDHGLVISLEETHAKGLFKKEKVTPVKLGGWLAAGGSSLMSAVARIEAALEDNEEGVERVDEGEGLKLAHLFIASLTDAQAASLQLPPPLPFVIRLDTTGALIADEASISIRFLGKGGKAVYPIIQGCFLKEGSSTFRMPLHIYRIVQSVEKIKHQNSLDDRLALIAEFRSSLTEISDDRYSADEQINGLKIIHGSALSIRIRDGQELAFDPILYAKDEVDISDGQISESQQLLTPRQQESFAQAFRTRSGAKRTYLADDVFVFVDPALRIATKVVRDMQDAPLDTRKQFIRSPHSFVREALIDQGEDEEFVDELVDASFLITEELSARVRDLGIWSPPIIAFKEAGSTDWKTIEFGIRVGDKKVVLNPAELDIVAQKIADGIRNDDLEVILDDKRSLPVNQATLDAVNAIRADLSGLPAITISDGEHPSNEIDNDEADEPAGHAGPSVLLVETNFDNETFVINTKARRDFDGYCPPKGLKSTPKSYQITGVAWLQECWSLGYSGALLADDMGLGKTFQTLCFLSWLKESRRALGLKKQPTLIVAPTSLLGTWQAEATIHLEAGNLGEFALLYGSHLKAAKTARQNDVTAGRATLNLESFAGADWVLTTYETMRDYHISLAKLPFDCCVFDEMQKLKNETSLMTNASRALNVDFKIGLTGTPVENSLQDLWTIMDTLMPGTLGLGSMRDFTKHYIEAEGDEDARQSRMTELHSRMMLPLKNRPPPMMRRMKFDVAKDLPSKKEFVLDRVMGPRQADAYHEALVTLREGRTREQKVAAFHRMRAISLHPDAVDAAEVESPDDFLADSARLVQTIELLDEIARRGEKVLLFVESIEMHRWLAVYLKERFQMTHKPDRIYGQVSAVARQEIVDRFQSAKNVGFDVLLLSPRAAGVGLTLTAANNVIHLTRWWNPAVEDQCTDRAYRIGQTQDVNIYYPRALHPVYRERTFDAILDGLLSRKREMSRSVLSPEKSDASLDVMVAELEGG